jgi:hypothetical protein
VCRKVSRRSCQVIGDKGEIIADIANGILQVVAADGQIQVTSSFSTTERNQLFLDAMKHAAALSLGRLPYLSSISLRRGHDIQVFGANLPVQADGDTAGFLPIHIVPFMQPLRVVVP